MYKVINRDLTRYYLSYNKKGWIIYPAFLKIKAYIQFNIIAVICCTAKTMLFC